MERIIVICGSAKTAVHNQVFLRGLLAVLEAAPEYQGAGGFAAEPTKTLRAFARIYAGWALSQDFYRAGLHLAAEPDLESFLRNQWDTRWAARKAANLYAQALCWHNGDISDNSLYSGELVKHLRSIEPRVLLMPGETDLYFRVADNEAEMPHLRQAVLKPILSIHGHRAGNPLGNPTEIEFLRRESRAWLEA